MRAVPAQPRPMLAALAEALARGATVLPLPDDAARADALRVAARPDDPIEDVALLVPTSGSTGTPRLVELRAQALRASADGTHDALGGAGQWLLALPVTHIAGIQVLVRSLLADTEPVVHEGPFDPESFATAADSLTSARRYTALVPTQLRRLLADARGRDALGRFDGVLVGGAATPPAMLAEAREAGLAIRTTYGMSETAGGCVYDGVPIGGARFDLDADGRISLAGPMLANGYRGRPGDPAFTGGRFVTSDVGRVVDGRLEVIGRVDDVIITGGVNVHPLAVEAVLARQPGVRDVCVAGAPDAEWGAAVSAWVVGPADDDVLRAAVRAELGVASVPKAIHHVARIPLLPSGKPDRRALAAG